MALEEEIKGADILIRNLSEQGVDTIFGVTGGASLEIFDALGRIGNKYGIKLIDTTKEDGAGFAAQGYARSTGKVGVVLTTSGPGATNSFTPLTDAYLDSIPLLLISGQVPSLMLGKGAFQEAPVSDMSSPTTKRSYLIRDINKLPDIVAEAFYIAQNGRTGPVHIDITKDTTQKETVFQSGKNNFAKLDSPNDLEHKVSIVFEQLKKSRKPIIYAGGGVISSDAYTELLELSEFTGSPVTNTVMGLGGFAGTHKHSLGMLGMHGTAYSNFAINGSPLGNYLDGADFVLAIGARFDDRVTGKVSEFAKNAYIAHVDIDPKENGKNKPPNVFVLADAKEFLKRLNARIKQESFRDEYSGWWRHLDLLKANFPLKYHTDFKDDRGMEIPTQYVIQKVWELARDYKPIVTTGVGQHQMWAAQYFLVDKPRKFLTSAGLGSMGFGLPAAVGAQAANPNKLVIDLDGDRSFWMTGYELETIARFNLPVKVVIFDNGGHGMVQQWQDNQYKNRYVASKYDNINFAEYAKLFGIKSSRVKKLEHVEPALKEMVNHKGPYVLHVDSRFEHCHPMIPAGKTIRDIIL